MKPSTSSPTICRAQIAAAVLVSVLAASSTAHAQLDPLLFLKRVPPTVVIVLDTSFQMLNDGDPGPNSVWPNGSIYDTGVYSVNDLSNTMKTTLQVPPGAKTYRRIYRNLRLTGNPAQKFAADGLEAVFDTDPRYNVFWSGTRYDMARLGIRDAVERNRGANFRWGMLRLRQVNPQRRTTCQQVSVSTLAGAADTGTCDGGGMLGIFGTSVDALNSTGPSTWANVVTPGAGTAKTILDKVGDDTTNGANANPDLIPAGLDGPGFEDRPLTLALGDAKTAVTAAITADTVCPGCRNNVIVLITGGRDHGTDPALKAAELKLIATGGGHKVPVFVVWVRPNPSSPTTADDEVQLQSIADASGGLLVRASDRSDVARAINLALQAAFSRPADFNNQSRNLSSEYYPVSPVIGTVNLDDASAATGTKLPNTVITSAAGLPLPQRNNFMLTAGFGVGLADAHRASWGTGFYGRLRAFRVYKPEADNTKASGYTFAKDGTALWPDLDGRPALAGQARVPGSAASRNIYTYIPGQGMVAFTDANASLIEPYLGTHSTLNPSQRSAADLINWIRALPLGAVIGSTPAIMDPPSLDPPPDDQYGRPDTDGTYAGAHRNRRSMIWVGANDGMLHGIDARTGYEVWAFVPFNLLPKLRALYEYGQPTEQFNYFVDQSPKIAEVKMDGSWRSYLVIGEGPGGTFYQAFDVTEAGMGGPDANSDDYASVLASFATGTRVQYKWSFPDYASFDWTVRQDVYLTSDGGKWSTASDATPGSVLRVYGELGASSSPAEKTVGFTWSDPAVGALNRDRTVNVAIVGSGFYPQRAESAVTGRGGTSAGHALYLIRMDTGKLLGNAGGSSCSGSGCYDVGDNTPAIKNALQADPTATGEAGAYVAKWVYIGDLDGRYYRFAFDATGAITTPLVVATTSQPIYASSALMYVGSANRFLFFSTGSDLLPTAPSSAGGLGEFRLFGYKDVDGVFTAAFTPIKLSPVVTDWRGLPLGERPSTSPAVAGEIVFFTTTVDVVPSCATTPAGSQVDSTYNLYAVTYKGTGAYAGPATGTTGGKKNGGSTAPLLFQSGAGRATAPFVVDQHLYFATSGASGPKVEAFGDPRDFNNGVGQVGVRILSWRELRQ